ncbi:PadR family transcriptional regulator, partial [Escherichia coli]|nr:PadR family transcriptional regulator [Escherichia coli]
MMGSFFGGRHGWRSGFEVRRRLGKGDLKYVILDLLEGGPAHGYEVIRALEERSRGFYSPSPGSVYPTL